MTDESSSTSLLFLEDDVADDLAGTLQLDNLYWSAVCFGDRLMSQEIVTKYDFIRIFEKVKIIF